MRGILIDPATSTVSEALALQFDMLTMTSLLGQPAAMPLDSAGVGRGDRMWFAPPPPERDCPWWMAGHPFPFYGRALIIGFDAEGSVASAWNTVDRIERFVRWDAESRALAASVR